MRNRALARGCGGTGTRGRETGRRCPVFSRHFLFRHVLREGALHPSHYVGAEIPILGQNAHWDPRGEYFVAEGDESDGTIRCFHPEHILVLNIEPEHLDFYGDLAEIEAVFDQLIGQTSGKIFFCLDDPVATRVCKSDRSVSYGFSENADYRAQDISLEDFSSVFAVFHQGEKLGEARLNVPGRHNVQNATGVIALASELGIPFEKIACALTKFQHARRRFEIKYASDRFLLVDDYAHHPTEIRATLATARSTGRKRVLTMFQPHRYTRTKALCNEFGAAFDQADRVVITDVYPASEPPIPGISGQTIADAISARGHRGVTYQSRFTRVHREIGNMSGLTSAFQNPQLATAIGLIKYAQAVQAERPQRRGFGRIFSRFIPGMR